VSALGHYLEEEGIATTQISLVREHTEAMRPPRALWVPFMLGRPFGVPDDPSFQRQVVLAALRLLDAPSGPVLDEFGLDAPQGDADEPFVCPVSFGSSVTDGDLPAELQREVADLATWHALRRQKIGSGIASLSGLSPPEAAKFLSDLAGNDATPPYRADLELTSAIRHASQDLRAYYLEAVAAQPGARAAAEADAWYWTKTAAGKTLMQLRETCMASSNEALQRFGPRVVPTRFAPR